METLVATKKGVETIESKDGKIHGIVKAKLDIGGDAKT